MAMLDCRCGKKLRVREDLAGKHVRCPSCGGILSVPADTAETAALPAMEAPAETDFASLAAMEQEMERTPQAADAPLPGLPPLGPRRRAPRAAARPAATVSTSGGFVGRMANGWELAKQCWAVLKMDKKLLVFPLFSLIACLAVLASFLVPLWDSDIMRELDNGRLLENPLALVILFAFYLADYFVIAFFNSALVACAVIRFNGGNPTLGDGFGAAMSRLPQIFGWALVAATVGMILRVIESYSEKVGRFIAALLGAAWGVMTFFVVPVLVVERVGPITAVKRSFATMRKVWGAGLVANFSLGLVMLLLTMVALAPGIIGVVLGGPIMWGGLALSAVLLILLALVSAALNTILMGALYLYAAEGKVPEAFDGELLQAAFY